MCEPGAPVGRRYPAVGERFSELRAQLLQARVSDGLKRLQHPSFRR